VLPAGTLSFSDQLDTINHVLSVNEIESISGVSIPVETLDTLIEERSPTIVKHKCLLKGILACGPGLGES
jgi:hypothetical protein